MQNLHIEHPEDLILEGDLTVFDALYSTAHISQKIDGAPSIVFGTNPNNGRFFVGTKSVFNGISVLIALFIIGSLRAALVELTVVVVPSTCKLPLTITRPSLLRPSG